MQKATVNCVTSKTSCTLFAGGYYALQQKTGLFSCLYFRAYFVGIYTQHHRPTKMHSPIKGLVNIS